MTKRAIILTLIFYIVLFGTIAVCRSQAPTPPPNKNFTMSWTDPNPAGKVKFFNIYKKIVTLYVYQATVLVPNLDWIVPLNTLSGTSFAVTADDGALESSRSVDGVVPAGPIAPSNVVITVAFP